MDVLERPSQRPDLKKKTTRARAHTQPFTKAFVKSQSTPKRQERVLATLLGSLLAKNKNKKDDKTTLLHIKLYYGKEFEKKKV